MHDLISKADCLVSARHQNKAVTTRTNWFEDSDLSCLETAATFVRNGRTEVRKWWHWVYTVGEIRRLLEPVGLAITNLYGSHDGQPYELGSPLLLIVAEKRASAATRKQIVNRKS